MILASYFLAYFHRTMSGVLKPEIVSIAINEGIDPNRFLGFFTAAYFYTYALAQLFVGPLIDMLGVRKASFILLSIMAIGTFMMSMGVTETLITGRLLIGFSASVAYLSYHRATSFYFPRDKQGLLTAIAIVIGNIGSLVSTYPLRIMIVRIGLYPTLVIYGLITLILALALFKIDIQDRKGGFKENFRTTINEIRVVLRDPHIYGIGITGITTYGVVVSFQSCWGQSFYESIGLDVYLSSKYLLLIPLVLIPTSLIVGYISDNIVKRRKPFLLISCFLSITSWVILLLSLFRKDPVLAGVGSITLGLTVGFHIVQAASAKEGYPKEISASTIAMMNVMTFTGISIFNTVSPIIGVRNTLLTSLIVTLLGFPATKILVKETLTTKKRN